MNTYHVHTVQMSPTLNGSSALEHFEHSNAIEIRNEIYPGLPHMYITVSPEKGVYEFTYIYQVYELLEILRGIFFPCQIFALSCVLVYLLVCLTRSTYRCKPRGN